MGSDSSDVSSSLLSSSSASSGSSSEEDKGGKSHQRGHRPPSRAEKDYNGGDYYTVIADLRKPLGLKCGMTPRPQYGRMKDRQVHIKEIARSSQFYGRIKEGDVLVKVAQKLTSPSRERNSGRRRQRSSQTEPTVWVIQTLQDAVNAFQEVYEAKTRKHPFAVLYLFPMTNDSNPRCEPMHSQESSDNSSTKFNDEFYWENSRSTEALHCSVKERTTLTQLQIYKEKLRAVADSWKQLISTSEAVASSSEGKGDRGNYHGFPWTSANAALKREMLNEYQRRKAIRCYGEAQALYERVEEQENEVNKHIAQQGKYRKHGFAVSREGLLDVITQDKLQQLGLSVTKVQQDLTQFLDTLQSNDGIANGSTLENGEINSDHARGAHKVNSTWEHSKYRGVGHRHTETAKRSRTSSYDERISMAELEGWADVSPEDSQFDSENASVFSSENEEQHEKTSKELTGSRKKMTLNCRESRKEAHKLPSDMPSQTAYSKNVQTAVTPEHRQSLNHSGSSLQRNSDLKLRRGYRNGIYTQLKSTPPPASRLPDTCRKQDKPRKVPQPGQGLEGERNTYIDGNSNESVNDKLKRVDDVPEAQLWHPKSVASFGVASAQKASAAAVRVALHGASVLNSDAAMQDTMGRDFSSLDIDNKERTVLKEEDNLSNDGSTFVQQLSLEDLAASPHLEVKDIARKVRDRLQHSPTDRKSRDTDMEKSDTMTSTNTCGTGKTHPRIAAIFGS
eukprot:gb/GECG01007554.1/.p1 GENE.gb/GECG01007554.1/~~gb/GECG01007554.1/.p1  ORF type:complete len:733 (+),score=102.31 gb/GECG01007554.1/:1-2199(+)